MLPELAVLHCGERRHCEAAEGELVADLQAATELIAAEVADRGFGRADPGDGPGGEIAEVAVAQRAAT
jgi:hypothetical protein